MRPPEVDRIVARPSGLVNTGSRAVRRGQRLPTIFLPAVGDEEHLVQVAEGRLAPADAWARLGTLPPARARGQGARRAGSVSV